MAESQEDVHIQNPAKRPAKSSVCRPKKQRKAQTDDTSDILPRFELQARKNAPALSDVRNLLLWLLTLEHGSVPQWVFTPNKHEVTQVVLLFLPGLDAFTLKDNSDSIPFLHSLLPNQRLFTILRSQGDRKSVVSYLRQVLEVQKDISSEIDCFQSIPQLADADNPQEYEQYILTEAQLASNEFPLDCEADYVETRPSTEEKQAKMTVLALDCEMVRTEAGCELARVSLVNLSGEILYDAFVKPQRPVTDYLTKYSGITAETLRDIQLSLQDARTEVLRYVSAETVLCGHSLENDLRALKIVHKRVIDTSVIYPHIVADLKWSLKRLSERYLRIAIQNKSGHDSVEDARAALKLTREKVFYGPKFGVPHPNLIVENLFSILSKYQRKTAVVGFSPETDLIQGNVTVDISGRVEKYIGSDVSLVVSQWEELVGKEDVGEALKGWNSRLETMVRGSPPGTGWIVATGEGDFTAYDRLLQAKTSDPALWTFQQEQQLRLCEAKAKKTFGVFFFPGQVPTTVR